MTVLNGTNQEDGQRRSRKGGNETNRDGEEICLQSGTPDPQLLIQQIEISAFYLVHGGRQVLVHLRVGCHVQSKDAARSLLTEDLVNGEYGVARMEFVG